MSPAPSSSTRSFQAIELFVVSCPIQKYLSSEVRNFVMNQKVFDTNATQNLVWSVCAGMMVAKCLILGNHQN